MQRLPNIIHQNFGRDKESMWLKDAMTSSFWHLDSLASYLTYFEHIRERIAFNFESAFTTVAVMEGCSERIHVDGNDHGTTWVLPLGDWEGAKLVIPQLDLEISVNPGELLGLVLIY